MPLFYKGADLIYQVQTLYDDTGAAIDPTTFTEITATFTGTGNTVTYTLGDSEIEVDSGNINIIIQRDDFNDLGDGLYKLKLETEETDTDFASNTRIRIGVISNAFNLVEP